MILKFKIPKHLIYLLLLAAGIFLSWVFYFSYSSLYTDPDPIRIGYFHGGRTHLLYRAYINRYFEEEGVDVQFFTKALSKDGLFEVPKSHEDMKERRSDIFGFGKMTGIRIVEEIEKGTFVGGTIGEASFLSSIDRGAPIIAVAMLGHDTKERPAHGIFLHKGLIVRGPEDLKGKTFVRRTVAGPLDAVLLREFIVSEGLELSDVTIIDSMPDADDLAYESLVNGEFDGVYSHFRWINRFMKKDIGYVYRTLDWINPETAMALLVFHRDYVEKHRDDVQRIVNAYVRRIKFEKELSEEERVRPKESGLQMVNYDVEGMNLPQYDLPPILRLDLLIEMRDLLSKYDVAAKNLEVEKYLDNSFVEKAWAKLN